MAARRIQLIQLPGIGELRLDWADDWTTGTTAYTVTGPRVSGVFVVTLDLIREAEALDADTQSVRVQYGRGGYWDADHRRQDRPVVNGVKLAGGTVVHLDTMRAQRLHRWHVVVHRSSGPYGTVPAPPATQERTAAVLHGVVGHWTTRPEAYALRLAAVRSRAAEVRGAIRRRISEQAERVAEATAELQQLHTYAAEADAAAHMPPGRSLA